MCYIKYQKCIDIEMADQVKSPKSIDTRSQRSIADTTVAILGDSEKQFETNLVWVGSR